MVVLHIMQIPHIFFKSINRNRLKGDHLWFVRPALVIHPGQSVQAKLQLSRMPRLSSLVVTVLMGWSLCISGSGAQTQHPAGVSAAHLDCCCSENKPSWWGSKRPTTGRPPQWWRPSFCSRSLAGWCGWWLLTPDGQQKCVECGSGLNSSNFTGLF